MSLYRQSRGGGGSKGGKSGSSWRADEKKRVLFQSVSGAFSLGRRPKGRDGVAPRVTCTRVEIFGSPQKKPQGQKRKTTENIKKDAWGGGKIRNFLINIGGRRVWAGRMRSEKKKESKAWETKREHISAEKGLVFNARGLTETAN